MKSKRRIFELLALKEKVERNNYYKQAKTITQEINKNNSLKEKLLEILNEEKKSTNSISALQLKSKKWYSLKIQEQIVASENKNVFLKKENAKIQKKIAFTNNKMKSSLEKAALHKKIENNNIEKIEQSLIPSLNKSIDN